MVRDRRLDEHLKRRMVDFNTSQAGMEWSAQRNQLPVAQIRDKLTQELRRVNAVVLCGDTGCGKTTQVNLKYTKHIFSLRISSFLQVEAMDAVNNV